MTWWLWLIGSLWAALFVILAISCWLDEVDVGHAAFIVIATGLIVGFFFLIHFTPADSGPEKPERTCTVQQYEPVWSGKSYTHEWVCIGWETQ